MLLGTSSGKNCTSRYMPPILGIILRKNCNSRVIFSFLCVNQSIFMFPTVVMPRHAIMSGKTLIKEDGHEPQVLEENSKQCWQGTTASEGLLDCSSAASRCGPSSVRPRGRSSRRLRPALDTLQGHSTLVSTSSA